MRLDYSLAYIIRAKFIAFSGTFLGFLNSVAGVVKIYLVRAALTLLKLSIVLG